MSSVIKFIAEMVSFGILLSLSVFLIYERGVSPAAPSPVLSSAPIAPENPDRVAGLGSAAVEGMLQESLGVIREISENIRVIRQLLETNRSPENNEMPKSVSRDSERPVTEEEWQEGVKVEESRALQAQVARYKLYLLGEIEDSTEKLAETNDDREKHRLSQWIDHKRGQLEELEKVRTAEEFARWVHQAGMPQPRY